MARLLRSVYRRVADADSAALAALSPESRERQPKHFCLHVTALAATKTGDGLIDPKLVLSWLLGALGAPAAAIGWLVPVREAGALLPQLALSRAVQNAPRLGTIWALGSIGQGAAVLAMAGAAATLEGAVAGWCIVALLAIFATCRSMSSVTYRALQGSTLVKSTRGTATGLAGTAASMLVFAFGGLLAFGVLPLTHEVILGALVLAAGLWIVAAVAVLGLHEEAPREAPQKERARSALGQLGLLKADPQLLRFTAVRALLAATALAPPFLVTAGLHAGSGRALGRLGPLVIASALASALSAYVWGRLADRSSRRVLIGSGLVAALPLSAVAFRPDLPESDGALPVALFVLMVAYQGVRLGRATHLVDMAPKDQRAAYTAVSNTVIGAVLLAGGVFGWVAEYGGQATVLGAFTGTCLLASVLAAGLEEVQSSRDGANV